MKKLTLILCALLLTACQSTGLKFGIAAHSPALDKPEYNSDNPLGLIRYECELFGWLDCFAEHESQFFRRERGLGYNKVGVMLEFSEVFEFVTGQELGK